MKQFPSIKNSKNKIYYYNKELNSLGQEMKYMQKDKMKWL